MERDERQRLRRMTNEVAGWADQARAVLTRRAQIDVAAARAVASLRRTIVDLRREGNID